jgi:ABC-2 type transport system permease protein
MTAALRYEWRRLWTIRSTYWICASTIAFQFIATLWIAATLDPLGDYSDYTGGQVVGVVISIFASIGASPLFPAYVIAILAVFSFAHEYRYGMIRTTLTAVPSRGAVFAAKAITIGGLAAVLSLVCMLVGLGNSALFVEEDLAANTGFVWKVILGIVVYSTMFALCGLALAGIIRHQAGALALILLFPSVIEGILHLILVAPEGEDGLNKVAAFLPFDAGGQMFARPLSVDIVDIFGYEPLEPVEGGLVFGVFTALMLALAGVMFFRRDA